MSACADEEFPERLRRLSPSLAVCTELTCHVNLAEYLKPVGDYWRGKNDSFQPDSGFPQI